MVTIALATKDTLDPEEYATVRPPYIYPYIKSLPIPGKIYGKRYDNIAIPVFKKHLLTTVINMVLYLECTYKNSFRIWEKANFEGTNNQGYPVVADINECMQKCHANENCDGFTFDTSNSRCYMKDLPEDRYIHFWERDGYEANKITGLKCDYWPRDSSDELVETDVRAPDYVGTAYTLVDECSNDTHDCDINATCEDTDAGFECHCNEAWTGDGRTCEVYCASGYDAVHPSQGDTGKFQDFAVGEGSSLDMANRGVSTIFVRANCAIITYEEENFGGRSWIWAGGESDTIYWTWEMAAITDNIEWNDRTKSYKCECHGMLELN